MRKWCKHLSLIAGGLVSLGALAAPAQAQFYFPGHETPATPGPGLVGNSLLQQPVQGGEGGPPSLPNDGSPNAFTTLDKACHWPQPLIWAGVEGVYGITKRAPLNVPLATTSTIPNAATDVGAIGQPSTQVIAGLGGLDLSNPSGTRITLGLSPTVDWMVPLEIIFLDLHERPTAFSAQSDINGNPLLAHPILATQPGSQAETVYLSSFPGLATGGISVESSIQYWGLQVQGVIHTNLQWGDEDCGIRFDLPIGLRYLDLEDGVNITSATNPTSPIFSVPFLGNNFGLGNRTFVTDVFKGNNQFRGAEFGVRLEGRWERFFVVAEPRVNIGSTRENVTINGDSTIVLANGNVVTTPGGILAVSTNGGSHVREQFTVLPEGDLTIGWDCFSWLRFQAGYNIAYWSNVVRAGDQISRTVDVRQIPTDSSYSPNTPYAGPNFAFKESSFLIQGISFGIVFSY